MAVTTSDEHEKYYVMVHSNGKIFSTVTGNELGKKGQDQISLYNIEDGKQSTKRRDYLMLECFQISNPHHWCMIRHENGDENDCTLENLAWSNWNWNVQHIDENNVFNLCNNRLNKQFRIYFGNFEDAENFSNLEEVKQAMIAYDISGDWNALEKKITSISINLT